MLTPSQEKAMDFLSKGENVFLTGEAGTGKSFLLKQFINDMTSKNKNIVVCAPTGVAAVNVGGVTMHRLFGMGTDMYTPTERVNIKKEIANADCIVVDEVSMCRADTFNYAMRAVRKAEKEHKKKIQVVVVGDFYQLPPVLRAEDKKTFQRMWTNEIEDKYKNKNDVERFAFTTKMWKNMDFRFACLKEVVRQSDHEFVDVLEKARIGNQESVRWINEHACKRPIVDGIYLAGRKDEVAKRNAECLAKVQGAPHIFKAEVSGTAKSKDFIAEETLTLKKGCRVMALTNDPKGKYVNGDMGYVLGIEDGFFNTPSIRVAFDKGTVCNIEPYEWEMKSYAVEQDVEPHIYRTRVKDENGKWQDISPVFVDRPYNSPKDLNPDEDVMYDNVNRLVKKTVGTFRQLPLKLAYAITIHKSQGQTFDKVNLNPSCFDDGMLYVALSRVRSIEGLHLTEPLYNNFLRTNPLVTTFYKDSEAEEQHREAEAERKAMEELSIKMSAPEQDIFEEPAKERDKSGEISFRATEDEKAMMKEFFVMLRKDPEKAKAVLEEIKRPKVQEQPKAKKKKNEESKIISIFSDSERASVGMSLF